MKKLLNFILLGSLFFSCQHKEKINRLVLDYSNEPQKFKISTQEDTVILGTKGTLLKIKNNSFIDENGLDVDSINISLEEFYTIQDFITNRLSTITADGKVLRSSGMINIQAESNGKKVFLKDYAHLKLGFPRVQDSRVANLFQGSKGKNDEIVWDVLEPVHIDTLVYVEYFIGMLAYGREEVFGHVSVVIGKDTISITEKNRAKFNDLPPKFRTASDGIDVIEYSSNLGFPFEKDRFYIFETTSLGWINCDIFIEEELLPFIVKSNKSNSDVFIILDSLNSVMYPDSINAKENEYIFMLPKEKSISVAAYAKENATHYFELKKVNSSFGFVATNQVDWKLKDIEQMIQKLN